jgi:uncharacterized protein YjeT (DUF2065 family)
MQDLAAGFALAVFVEGAMYALFPQPMKRAALILLSQPEATLRMLGLGLTFFSVALVWLFRHA